MIQISWTEYRNRVDRTGAQEYAEVTAAFKDHPFYGNLENLAFKYNEALTEGVFDDLLQRLEIASKDPVTGLLRPVTIDGYTFDIGSFFTAATGFLGALGFDISFGFNAEWFRSHGVTTIRDVAFLHFARNILTLEISYDDVISNPDLYSWVPDNKNAFHKYGIGNEDNFKVLSANGHHEYIFRNINGEFEIVNDPRNNGSYNFWPAGPSLTDDDSKRHNKLDIWAWQVFGDAIDDISSFSDRDNIFYSWLGGDGAPSNLPVHLPKYSFLGISNIITTAVNGSVDNDVLSGDDRHRYEFNGLAGDDFFFTAPQDDTIDGGDGFDTVSYSNSSGAVAINLQSGFARHGSASWDNSPEILTSIEGIIGSTHSDIIVGSTVANLLGGGMGNDHLYGDGGDDTLYGGADNDLLNGGTGNDSIIGAEGTDIAVFNGTSNTYTISRDASGVIIVVSAAEGTDTLSGVETLQFSDRSIETSSISVPYSLVTNSDFLDFGDHVLSRNDDGSSAAIDITSIFESGIRIGNVTYTKLYVNNNGNVTFGSSLSTFTPGVIGGTTGLNIIAPFWADADTRVNAPGNDGVFWDFDTTSDSIIITWSEVGYFSQRTDRLNSFQLELKDRGEGNIEIIFRYDDIEWTTGSASGGVGGLGGTIARGGFSLGSTYFELPSSGSQAGMLFLDGAQGNRGTEGVWQFLLQNGLPTGFGLVADDTYIGADAPDSYFGLEGNDSILGRGGNDGLYGGVGNDSIYGGEQNDFLTGGSGDDLIDGGDGTGDRAVFSGDLSDYIITGSSETSLSIVDMRVLSPDGTDVVSGVENFTFADGTFTIAQIVNNSPVIVSNGAESAAAISVGENNTAVTTVVAIDPDAAPVFVYSISGGADAVRFTINATTGLLAFVTAPNFEIPSDVGLNNVYDVVVQVSDGNLTDSQAIAVTVGNQNETPTITSNGAGSSAAVLVVENNTGVTTVVAIDPDAAPVFVYSISGGADAVRFTINANTGVLAFVTAPNFEIPSDVGLNNVYDVVVQVSDGTLTDSQAIAVTVSNFPEGFTINGTAKADTISMTQTVVGQQFATSDSDQIYGFAGNDILNGGLGVDGLIGGVGNDTYITDGDDVITEALLAGTDVVQSSGDFTLAANLENLVLTGVSAINGTGNTLANTITGNSAANTLNGGGGVDKLIGGLGNDTFVTDGGDMITEALNGGIDLIQSSVDFTLGANLENLTLTGTAAINGTGNGLSNIITGNASSNTLNGGLGADMLYGGMGNDTYITGAGDLITEAANAGTDTVNSATSMTLEVNLENLLLTGSAAINGTGNNLNNYITGNAAKNILSGGTGADTIIGGGGKDALFGDAGNDELDGGTGADILIGGMGDDTYIVGAGDVITEAVNAGTDMVKSSISMTLGVNIENLLLTGTAAINGTGNSLNNNITGNAAKNTLNGGTGSDTLTAGTGADSLIGGSDKDFLYGGVDINKDVFVFQSIAESGIGSVNRDVIYNFVSGTDDIGLSEIDANTALNGNQIFQFNGTTAKANAIWYTDIGTDLVIRGDVNGDSIADFEIQVSTINSLLVGDFIL